jgi:hypothetical protein
MVLAPRSEIQLEIQRAAGRQTLSIRPRPAEVAAA